MEERCARCARGKVDKLHVFTRLDLLE